jgi:hypothetical protein
MSLLKHFKTHAKSLIPLHVANVQAVPAKQLGVEEHVATGFVHWLLMHA